MTTVWAVQQPTGRDRTTGQVINTMDLSPAKRFGELRFILREFENPFSDIGATAGTIQQVLEDNAFSKDDFLLLTGNPILIGLVSAIAYDLTGQLRVLQWDRPHARYLPVTIVLDPEEEALDAA